MAVVFVWACWGMAHHPFLVRAETRWLFGSNYYKNLVLAEPLPKDGSLRHVEWDGSGFAGTANNHVYLAYDPHDLLPTQLRVHSFGRFEGIPCGVVEMHRLAEHWYFVKPYTDYTWDECQPYS